MPELCFELVGTEDNWKFPKPTVRVGRDPTSDLVLPSDQFPMVGRDHLVVRIIDSQYWVEDLKSQNGTYLNGKRVDKALLSPGDKLRLGSDGPELRVEFVTPNEGLLARVPATQVQVQPTKPGASPTSPSDAGPASGAESSQKLSSANRTLSDISTGEEAMIEQKINVLRNLVVVLLVLVLVLGGLLFRQSQQIDQNRQAIKDLDTKAQNAVALFQPKLDERLNQFETRLDTMQKSMDSVDQKIRQAEDHFVRRLDQELPTMMEHVVQREISKARDNAQRTSPR